MFPDEILFIISEYSNFIPVNKTLYKHKLDNHIFRLRSEYVAKFREKKIKLLYKNIHLNLSGNKKLKIQSYLL